MDLEEHDFHMYEGEKQKIYFQYDSYEYLIIYKDHWLFKVLLVIQRVTVIDSVFYYVSEGYTSLYKYMYMQINFSVKNKDIHKIILFKTLCLDLITVIKMYINYSTNRRNFVPL